MAATVDGRTSGNSVTLANPAKSVALIEIDTRGFADVVHYISLQAQVQNSDGSVSFAQSVPLPLSFANSTKFPGWESQAGTALSAEMQFATSQNSCTLWFFN